ncbi:hypothetical protein [Butyrivibrio proteoclasticus]|uniref:hypothetical protein n=1 Tax=Butyrivibrio proteoclasticus TaxID=43305 RepID=UPI00047A14D9|nr:hypothetical protein [Butyrivibrio proteoclasticus]
MKNTYQKIIKEVIGPGAKEHGYTYSCSGAMIMTKPLAMYKRTVDGYTQMIYIYQNLIKQDEIVFCYKGLNKGIKYNCSSEEEFEKAVEDMKERLENGGYAELDDILNSPYRLKISDHEYFRDSFELLWKKFETNHDMGKGDDLLTSLELLDKFAKETSELDGEALINFLYEIAAEYGKVISELPDSYMEWSKEACKFFAKRRDTSVIQRITCPLEYVFKSYEMDKVIVFSSDYRDLLTLQEKRDLSIN